MVHKFLKRYHPHPSFPEGVKKLISFFFTSFRRKPESSVFKPLAIDWTPVFTGVTAEIQFFHSFPRQGGGNLLLISMGEFQFFHTFGEG